MEPSINNPSQTPPSLAVESALSAPAPSVPALQQALAEVAHEINNPLAIISGNAQLLLELTRLMDLDPDVVKPIRDIEEASRRLAMNVGRLNALRDSLGDALPGGDGL